MRKLLFHWRLQTSVMGRDWPELCKKVRWTVKQCVMATANVLHLKVTCIVRLWKWKNIAVFYGCTACHKKIAYTLYTNPTFNHHKIRHEPQQALFTIGVVKVLSFIALFCEYYALANNFWPSQSKQPTFDYPQMHKYQKNYHQSIFFAFILERTPLYSKEPIRCLSFLRRQSSSRNMKP